MTIKTKILNLFRRVFMIPFLEKLTKQNIENNPSSFFIKLAPNNYQYKKNSIRTFNYKGTKLAVDISDYVGHYLYFGFEDKAQEKLIQLAKSGDTVLDIGTNIGSTLLQFANKVGNNGRVYGFEPDLINYKICLDNINLNSFTNIEVANIGLGNENGSFNLVVDTETNRGGNRISYNIETQKTSSKIYVVRLDEWIKNNKITKVDLIKIDVEGFELNVLKGAKEVLVLYKPVLFIELDDNNLRAVGNSANELVLYLEALNYLIESAETGEIIDANKNFTDCHYDIICKIK